MLRHAESRAQTAEERLSELSTDLDSLRDEVRRRDEEIAKLRAELTRKRKRPLGAATEPLPGLGEPTENGSDGAGASILDEVAPETVSREIAAVLEAAEAVSGQIAGVLRAAERSAAAVVETARESTAHQLVEAERLWREVENAYTRFVSWQRQMEPMLHDVEEEMAGLDRTVRDVPARVQEAFRPVSESVASAQQRIERLLTAWKPPLAAAPRDERGSPS